MIVLLVALGVGVLAVVLPACYLYAVSLAPNFPTLRNKRICLLIAHPDDEAMFFAPTLLALTAPETGNHVKILCLSSGNAAGLGETRKQELVKSGLTLGLRQEDDVFVIDSEEFPDSMTATWSASKISALLCSAFAPTLSSPVRAGASPPAASIDALITFDEGGVSAHPNHISLYHGARAFAAALGGSRSPVDIYALSSVSMLRKYTSFLDAVWTLLSSWGALKADEEERRPPKLVFLSGLGEGGLGTAWKAMTKAHISQMVWFRYGWITFSRYMLMNDLDLVSGKAAAS